MQSKVLNPTLWRTCRVLANRTRLRIFNLLMRQRELVVGAVARSLGIGRPLASLYLRALESRGLLEVRRQGRWVSYRLSRKTEAAIAGPLVSALSIRMRRDANWLEALFRVATAFANPGRIEVFQTLRKNAMSLRELRQATGISVRTLRRHLRKLEARGFVTSPPGRRPIYASRIPEDVFGRTLAAMAASR